MLKEHPHIQRIRISEMPTDQGVIQRLIVETDINLANTRSKTENQKLENLKAFLNNIAMNDFGDFREIEIRQYDARDDYDTDMVA